MLLWAPCKVHECIVKVDEARLVGEDDPEAANLLEDMETEEDNTRRENLYVLTSYRIPTLPQTPKLNNESRSFSISPVSLACRSRLSGDVEFNPVSSNPTDLNILYLSGLGATLAERFDS